MKSILAIALCTAAVVGLASAGTVQQADDYIDELLRSARNINESPFTPDGVSIPDFNITVASTRLTNRKFKAAFMHGRVTGLTNLTRKAHCEPTHWSHGNITLECTLDLSSVFAGYAVTAKGHTLNGRESLMDVFVRIREGTSKFVAQSFPNRPAYIKVYINEPLSLRTEILPDPELNPSRRQDFASEAQKHASDDIRQVLATVTSSALTNAAKGRLLPAV